MSSSEPNQTVTEIEKLRQEVDLAKRKKLFFDNLKKTVPLTGIIVFAVLASVYFFFNHKYPIVLIVGIFYLAIAIIYPAIDLGKSIGLEIDAMQSEISLKSTGSDAIEERAERLFKAHEIDLKRYYDLSLKQSNSIFIVGILCILVGFFFMGATIYIVYYSIPALEFRLRLLIGILGALSGILTNFIAVVYLKMFSETIGSFTTFHNKLVSTNHLHFANFLISKVEDKSVRSEIIKAICEKISESIKN